MKKNKCVVYIGDFDLRNENVQAHLVKNNGKILNNLGYVVAYIGINRIATEFSQTATLSQLNLGANTYLELPNTLNFNGLFKCKKVIQQIISHMNNILSNNDVQFVISYQAPTYSVVLTYISKWCKNNNIKYIVNCADLPIFNSQPFVRRLVMQLNWHRMHTINQKKADGVIAVSKYISDFYFKKNRPSTIIPPLFDENIVIDYKGNYKTTFLYAGTPFAMLDRKINTKGMKDRLDKVIELFLELSKRNIEYKFLVVGITKEAYITCVPRHKEVLEKETNIEFVGRRPHNDTLSLLTQADFMINLRDENIMTAAGLSTKVVESVSVGTPVVMNSIGDTFDYLIEEITGYALKGNIDDDTALLAELCALSVEKRIAIKKQCYGQQTFSLGMFQDKMHYFLKQVEGLK